MIIRTLLLEYSRLFADFPLLPLILSEPARDLNEVIEVGQILTSITFYGAQIFGLLFSALFVSMVRTVLEKRG